ncbi:hypothetical protein K505DRAFT_368112 [Melanomma pulvis-pyrius CBS 109.77]|uniref:Uncharacterized protein n=1 Tax=Melanomma pulvis-pyrius CBS 109.77 TaxID=1314802 RepID=A0A6A6WR62_9PLEO|nr:hypothetical protein K505DRAFT_368112 [Melanomma pulvis-pyrius CBS 109.77]
MVCYMVVSPDPNDGCFYVKFGDGRFRASYGTDNPDHLGVENTNHTDDAIYTPSVTGMGVRGNMKVRLGKALEWEYLQCWSVAHSDREWHFIPESTDLPLEQLRQSLKDAMRLFPSLSIPQDMDMESDQLTLEFAKIMGSIEDYEDTPKRKK